MISIRLAKEEDLEKLAAIYEEVFRVFDVGEEWTKEAAYKLLKYYFDRYPDLAFVAEYDGKVVGAFFADVRPWWDGDHLVDGEIFVHPDYQKRGVGTELMKIMFKTAIDKYGVVGWDAITFKGEYPLEWYKKLGFEESKSWIVFGGDVRKVLKKLEEK